MNYEKNLFSFGRTIETPDFQVPDVIKSNSANQMEGLKFMSYFKAETVPVAFFDPQYRGVLDKMQYGNEGQSKQIGRSELEQMDEQKIKMFITRISELLIQSGHLFLWIDKFHLCEGFKNWIDGTDLSVVDMIVWHKDKMGMGYRTRRCSEYCIILQKSPTRVKNVWTIRDIPDVWVEKVTNKSHPHCKPVSLQARLISAVTNDNDVVLDPSAGSYSVMSAAHIVGRNFIGCDLV